jgi:hypothetical protein
MGVAVRGGGKRGCLMGYCDNVGPSLMMMEGYMYEITLQIGTEEDVNMRSCTLHVVVFNTATHF